MNNKHIYQQLANNIKQKIHSGEYRVGQYILSERKMSEMYKINRLTVRKAIQTLVDEGFIEKIQGKGNVVIKEPSKKNIVFGENVSNSLSRSLIQKGFVNKRKLISLKKVSFPKDILLKFVGQNDMYELIRLTEIDEKPYALQICYFSTKYYDHPERFDFESHSLYTYMDMFNKMPVIYKEEMEIIKANDELKDVFNLKENPFLFKVNYQNYSENNELLEYTIAYYLSENTVFRHVSGRN